MLRKVQNGKAEPDETIYSDAFKKRFINEWFGQKQVCEQEDVNAETDWSVLRMQTLLQGLCSLPKFRMTNGKRWVEWKLQPRGSRGPFHVFSVCSF